MWHIGVLSIPSVKQWMSVVVEQFQILKTLDVDLYVGFHGTDEQARIALDYFEKVKPGIVTRERMLQYQGDIWEIPTVKWLIEHVIADMGDDDIVSYLHTKGVTGQHGGHVIRQYMMDHLFVRWDENIRALSSNPKAKTMGCFAQLGFDNLAGWYWCTFWISKVGHVRSLPPPDPAEGRWAVESFLRISVQSALYADGLVAIQDPQSTKVEERLFNQALGVKWMPSQCMIDAMEISNRKFPHPHEEVSSPPPEDYLESRYSDEGGGIDLNWVYVPILLFLIVVVMVQSFAIYKLKQK